MSLQRRTSLVRKKPLRAKTELCRSSPLEDLRRGSRSKRSGVSPATAAQRRRVADRACIVCARQPCHPAHLIDRSLAPSSGDVTEIVVPLCPHCHREYDDGRLDLSPYLEPRWRDAVAAAVGTVGLFRALRRITKRDWMPVDSEYDHGEEV